MKLFKQLFTFLSLVILLLLACSVPQNKNSSSAGGETSGGTGAEGDAVSWTEGTSSSAYYNSGNVGIGTNTPEFKLTLNNDGGILSIGAFGSGNSLSASGAGAKLIWYPRKAAFRAGYVNGSLWDDGNITNYSIALGYNATAGLAATSLGRMTTASGNYSTAMGNTTTASAQNATAMGYGTTASGSNSTALGYTTNASGASSTALGNNTTASGGNSTAMGIDSTASGDRSTAIGTGTTAQSYNSLAIGRYNTLSGSTTTWYSTEPLFVAGNGSGSSSTSNALTLYKNGNMTIAGTLTESSDIRLKTNIEELKYGLAEILKLNGIAFNWERYKEEEKIKHIGLSAQDVQLVIPELVSKLDDGEHLGINYNGFVPVLINAIKEQQKEIEELKKEIKDLKLEMK